MTVALPVERYSPFPWKHASQLPCPDHQLYSGYHGKPFVASDGGYTSDDVPPELPRGHRHGTPQHATSLDLGNILPTIALDETPHLMQSLSAVSVAQGYSQPTSAVDFTASRKMTVGGCSMFEEGANNNRYVSAKNEPTLPSCLAVVGRKRKLCEMLDGSSDDRGFRSSHQDMMADVHDTNQSNGGGVIRLPIMECYSHCRPAVTDCCDCDSPELFFPDVSNEIELPMSYESDDGDDYRLRSIPAEATTGDFMDNVIPDILPSSNRSSDMLAGMTDAEAEAAAESAAAVAAACDRRHLLNVSLHKMRGIDDPETSLRRSVLIANLVTRLRHEIRQETYCRTVLPKKRRSYRRPWFGSPNLEGRLHPEPSICIYQGNLPRKRFDEGVQCDVYPNSDMFLNNGGRNVEHGKSDDCDFEQTIYDPAQEDDKKSLLGDIDSIFQSLMACVGGP